jgi:hypothetical protein
LFSDTFANGQLDPAWAIVQRHGEYQQQETECNTAGQVSVVPNLLTITTAAIPTSCGDFNLDGSVRTAPQVWPYATGDIQWRSVNFTYGTVTVRAKLPPHSSNTWPAIWLLTSKCQATNLVTATVNINGCPQLETAAYTEIDATECFGGNWCQLALSQPGEFPKCDYHPETDANWHVFSMTWTPTSITTSIDGTSTGCSFTSAAGYAIPSTPMFLIIQTQTGGIGGTPANLPATFQVSSVLVTQP